jgi:hypothetical protein
MRPADLIIRELLRIHPADSIIRELLRIHPADSIIRELLRIHPADSIIRELLRMHPDLQCYVAPPPPFPPCPVRTPSLLVKPSATIRFTWSCPTMCFDRSCSSHTDAYDGCRANAGWVQEYMQMLGAWYMHMLGAAYMQ